MENTSKESKEFRFIGRGIYFPKWKILVITDLHIGYEEMLNEQGILIPRVQFKEIIQDLEKIFKKIKEKIEEIIILGDLKHEFGKISSQEWRETKEVLDFLKKKGKKIVLVKGNHDMILEPIAKREELRIKDYYIKERVCFLHGDKIFPECLDRKIRILIIGHRHPAVVLSNKYKREKYKCFLVGEYKHKKIIVLPSFFPFIEGSDIIGCEKNKMFIPEKNLKNFEVYIAGDEVYRFGKLKSII